MSSRWTVRTMATGGAGGDWFTASTPYTYADLVTADTVIVPACHDQALTPPDAFSDLLGWAVTHLDEPLTVEQLARRANISTRTLHRRFLSRAGVKPLDWLNGQRLRHAQRLLETGDSSVERIASACGFGTAAALRRHFRTSLGTTPDAYRRTFTTAAT